MYMAKKELVFNHLLDAGSTYVQEAKPVGLEILAGVL
jgi:hypothetical protein